jgi:hypothetical protein
MKNVGNKKKQRNYFAIDFAAGNKTRTFSRLKAELSQNSDDMKAKQCYVDEE